MSFVVGLTGGIGSGKSAVASLFAAYDVSVIDTDVIAHELTAPRGAAMPEITRVFGSRFVDAQGALDRRAMRRHVFSQPAGRAQLERILHPMIRAAANVRLNEARGPYGLLVVPLLVESGDYIDRVDRVLVVDCNERVQIARTMARSGLEEAEVRAMMVVQADRESRLRAADNVIDNNGSLPELESQVAALHRRYLALARSKSSGAS